MYLIEDLSSMASVEQGDMTVKAAMSYFPGLEEFFICLAVLWAQIQIFYVQK